VPFLGKSTIAIQSSLMGLLIFFGLTGAVSVEANEESSATATLSAPASVLELLQKYFELPVSPLLDDAMCSTFMRRAQREISELLATEGYFSSKVTLQTTTTNGVPVVDVVPGPRMLVADVSIAFKGDLATDEPTHRDRIKKLIKNWSLAKGRPFRSTDWETAKAELLANVAEADYAAAQIELSQADIDIPNSNAHLILVVDSGPAFRFGDLAVSGLDRYEKNLVADLATFHTGDPYRRDQLLAFQARLQNMPQFSSVRINIDPDVSVHEAVPVQVILVEAKPRQVSVGIGYSSNNGARSEINYLDHNIFDRAWSLSSKLRLEQSRQTLSTGIETLPNPMGYRLSWGASGQATLIQKLKTVDRNLGVTRSRTLGQIETQIGVNWQDENRRPEGGIASSNQALVLDWRWHRGTVDEPLYPSHGDVIEIRIGGASRQLLSDQDFLRSYARHQMWWPIGARDILSLRSEAGFTLASSRVGIPQEYLFRAGGSQSVRGYAYQSLGMHEGVAVVGGRVLATGSLEYTHWLNRNWGAALFADLGGAGDILHNLPVSIGYGSGARWRSPVGPLALDLAWGRATHAVRLHFSIAVAF
jgi:translocation and assembly module TamA